MKKVYRIYCIVEKDVCIPSDDYHSRRNDWYKESIKTLSIVEDFDTEEEAMKELENPNYSKGEYTILPVYIKA